jgi:hypothetical protein
MSHGSQPDQIRQEMCAVATQRGSTDVNPSEWKNWNGSSGKSTERTPRQIGSISKGNTKSSRKFAYKNLLIGKEQKGIKSLLFVA